MSAEVDVDTLIVGAGFAGLSVASRLQGTNYIVLDRGETFDPAIASSNYRLESFQRSIGDLGDRIECESRVIRSEQETEQVSLPLSVLSANVYSYRQGGISNWWGAYAKRISAECFAQDGVLAWPIGLEVLDPFYREAEQMLRVHGDPKRDDATVYGAMPGWDIWREHLGTLFPGAHVTSEAKNVTDQSGSTGMGLCTGNGQCTMCANDAAARPENVFLHTTVYNKTMVEALIFEGAKAVSACCRSDGESFELRFNRLVIAGGSLENVALLRRSQLPKDVPRHLIGRRYQDHTAAEIVVRMPKDVPYCDIGAECHVELADLSGMINGLEVSALFLTNPPGIDLLMPLFRQGTLLDITNFKSAMSRMGRIYLQIEVPPEWDLRIRSRGEQAYLYTLPYYRNLAVLDSVVMEIVAALGDKGLRVETVVPHYRHGFGGHHYAGVTPMSKNDNAVLTHDHRLIGTENVYINGASAIPRCGNAGPTLSIVAMGLRLGDLLQQSEPTHSTTPH